MESKQEPEIFGYVEFCRAVSGYTNGDLVRIFLDNYGHPLLNSINRDMPRIQIDLFIDDYLSIRNANIKVPLLDISIGEMYEAFRKFRADEEYVHPPKKFADLGSYWKETYEKIDNAYLDGDEKTFKEGIQELINKILHDSIHMPAFERILSGLEH